MTHIYNLIIQPLVFILGIVFVFIYRLVADPAVSVILLSIAVNFLALPLYKRADAMQREEQAKKKKMQPMLSHIRNTFSGDERYMMVSAYYRVEHYNPISILKESVPLMLQIPIFIAAYRYLSSATVLQGAPFGIIADLGAPDQLLKLGGNRINILPVIMTVLNLASGIVYSKDQTRWQKVQIFLIAGVFLILLYNSPSGLVLYWTTSQLFSLCKNLQFKYRIFSNRNAGLAVSFVIIISASIALGLRAINNQAQFVITESLVVLSIIKIILVALELKNIKLSDIKNKFIQKLHGGRALEPVSFPEVVSVEAALTVLLGICIPSAVFASSAIEFVDLSTGIFPTNLMTYPLSVYAGLFVVWCTILYCFCGDGGKRVLHAVLWVLLGVCLANYFFFTVKTGFLYTDFSFDGKISFSNVFMWENIAACLAIAIVLIIIRARKKILLRNLAVIVCIGLAVLSGSQIWTISSSLSEENKNLGAINTEGILTLSKTGRNVIVMMLDRAIGLYVPYIIDEKPELKEAFEGFVYYPNTISFGKYTNFGTPALFGGYEYTPTEINKRDTEVMVEKHNEALKVLPTIFSENGYNVIVTDPPWAGYTSIPDLSIYDDIPNVKAYTLDGQYSDRFMRMLGSDIKSRQEQNVVMYSLFRTAPLFMKEYIYDNGKYMSFVNKGNAYTQTFIDSYSVLDELPFITSVSDDNQNYFLMMQNATPHNPVALDPPEYEVTEEASKAGIPWEERTVNGRTMHIRNPEDWASYCVNVATYQELAKWLDMLREAGVYDNTRIIFVADHGYYLGQFDELLHPDGLDVESVNPLLMVKDFNATGPLTQDDEFMTNADVATLAVTGVIENPVNPYTGKQILNEAKYNEQMLVSDSDNPHPIGHAGRTTFITSGSHWWSVHNNIFDINNWEIVGEGDEK